MALSEQERKLLEQLEASLKAEDPQLADTLSGAGQVRIHRRRATLAGIGFVLGIVALIGGIQLHWAVSILGFAIMLASAIVGISSWQRVSGDGGGVHAPPRGSGGPGSGPSGSNKEFMDKLEERWKKRQQGDL
jgi:hypothetical protein